VVGDWEFTLGPLASQRSSCGHAKPDNPNGQPPLDFQGHKNTFRLSLRDPDVASTADGLTGMWTMIYDEGFEVAIGDQVFFAFSKFNFVNHGKKRTNVSHCDATEVGWYHNKERTAWGCYFGRKVGGNTKDPSPDASERPQAIEQSHPKSLSSKARFLSLFDSGQEDDDESSGSAVQVSEIGQHDHSKDGSDSATTWAPKSAGFDEPMQRQWQQSVADALSCLQLGWTAAKYEIFQGKTPRDLNKFAGVRHARTLPHLKPVPVEADSAEYSSFLGLGSRVRRVTGVDSFDWRNADGQNWLQPVVAQGDCGSCYTISTVHMLTSRNRIKHGDKAQPAFSVSFPLYCSEYNQGCDGGYGFLQSKWSEDVGLVPESCARFSQGGGSCRLAPGCSLGQKRYRAVNHHYVGGYYGGSAEEQIRSELVNDGPMVMSFEPKEDFMYYSNGIYRSAPNKIHQEWEQVDHAVLLVGYGQEKGKAFWTMQNSWGDDWGEDGYFRMARGSDESGCESIVVAADVLEEDSNVVLDAFLSSI
jgi:cathepsin C